jgi:hypothetical protein
LQVESSKALTPWRVILKSYMPFKSLSVLCLPCFSVFLSFFCFFFFFLF